MSYLNNVFPSNLVVAKKKSYPNDYVKKFNAQSRVDLKNHEQPKPEKKDKNVPED